MSTLYNAIFGINEKQRKNQELFKLHEVPQREKGDNAPKFQPQKPNMVHRADLLFLPDDKGYKYALVVVDIGSRYCDAVPLKTKSNAEVIKAFNTIYTR